MIFLISFIISTTYAAEKPPMPQGKIDSPYEACKQFIIVDKNEYQKKKVDWDKYEKSCGQKIIQAQNFGVTSIGSLQKSMENYDFAGKVANKVLESLKKSRQYAECSSLCMNPGAKSCPADLSPDKKIVDCELRKKEIKEGMNVNTRKIRMALALATDAPGLLNVNVRNVLQVGHEKMINTNLRDFEIGTPNPVGRTKLTERELSEAHRRIASERQKLEQEFKDRGLKYHGQWMSLKLMDRFEEYQKKYRQLIYEEAPIFSVIDSPVKYDDRNDPVWTDAQLKKAFDKLVENGKKTEEKVIWSISKGQLEFDRYNGEALGHWLKNLSPGSTEEHDLLFFTQMHNQVEDVLRENPSLCGVATSLYNRFNSKETQNGVLAFAGSIASLGVVKGAVSASSRVFNIGRAISGAEAAGLTGLAMGSVYLGDSFRQYSSAVEEAATKSGVGGYSEGSTIGSAQKVEDARDNVKMSLMFAPLDIHGAPVAMLGGWGAGKVFYSSLAKEMAKDLPEAATLAARAGKDTAARDRLVDQWLAFKMKSALKLGYLKPQDQELFKTKEGREIFNRLVADIEKSNPDFFKNLDNVDFFFKTAAAQMKKEKGDPSDLPAKTESLLKLFNTSLLDQNSDTATKRGMLVVYDSAVAELRESFRKDPATYAKFNSDRQAQEKILTSAMRRAGLIDEKEAELAAQCALPKR
jgi:hypothetical protein